MSTRRVFSFILLTLWFLSVSADVFLSIDCGATDTSSYKDSNLITWSGDQNYVQNGETRKVPPNASISHVLDTLRVFTTRKRNCYVIDSITKGRVLLRVHFYYGNYDGNNKPPSFDLSFDGNYWATVTSPDYVYYEVIYVMKKDSISVCLDQRNAGEFPFISALEVRALDSYMYSYFSDEYPLLLMSRTAYGANETIRYIDDPFDRIWVPSSPGTGLTTISSGPFLSQIAGFADNPPPLVLQNAVTPINPNSSIILFLPLPNTNMTICINMYFSEVLSLKPNQTRSFTINIDNRSIYILITPPSGNFSEIFARNFTASSNTVSLIPTSNSTLPPLINALELFSIGDALTNGTFSGDVKGLASLRNAFDVLQEWKGDPCLPAPYLWDWINCSSESTPRVTALFLSGFNLSGKLPDFSSMDALETIDLHKNSLSGPIPDFLGALPKLKNLNLADNQFIGSIPTSLLQKNGQNIVVSGNPELCVSGKPCSSPTTSVASRTMNESKLLMLFGITMQLFVYLTGVLIC